MVKGSEMEVTRVQDVEQKEEEIQTIVTMYGNKKNLTRKDWDKHNCLYCGVPFNKTEQRMNSANFYGSICVPCFKKCEPVYLIRNAPDQSIYI